MSIQNVPHTAGHSIILDPASFTLAQAPSRLPADTYDLVVSLGTDYHTFDRLLMGQGLFGGEPSGTMPHSARPYLSR